MGKLKGFGCAILIFMVSTLKRIILIILGFLTIMSVITAVAGFLAAHIPMCIWSVVVFIVCGSIGAYIKHLT